MSDKILDLILTKLDKLDTKMDKLDDRLDSSEKIAVKQEANLDEHMRRSDLLEKRQDKLRGDISPLLKIHTVIWGAGKAVVGLGVLISVLVGIMKLLK